MLLVSQIRKVVKNGELDYHIIYGILHEAYLKIVDRDASDTRARYMLLKKEEEKKKKEVKDGK